MAAYLPGRNRLNETTSKTITNATAQAGRGFVVFGGLEFPIGWRP